jgi:hypothetical protein
MNGTKSRGQKDTWQKTGISADGMTQVVEHLPSKHEALSSNPDTTITKKKKRN